MRVVSIRRRLGLALGLAVASGCGEDIVSPYAFVCETDADCVAGFVCLPDVARDAMICQPQSSVHEGDVTVTDGTASDAIAQDSADSTATVTSDADLSDTSDDDIDVIDIGGSDTVPDQDTTATSADGDAEDTPGDATTVGDVDAEETPGDATTAGDVDAEETPGDATTVGDVDTTAPGPLVLRALPALSFRGVSSNATFVLRPVGGEIRGDSSGGEFRLRAGFGVPKEQGDD